MIACTVPNNQMWNYTASSTGTLASCAWEDRSHQLARPVGIPYAGSDLRHMSHSMPQSLKRHVLVPAEWLQLVD